MRQSMIITAQDHALNTNNMRNKEFGKNYPQCAGSTVKNIALECPKLVQNEYKKTRHDKLARVIHWKVLKSDERKMLWDFPIQTAQ